MNITCFDDLLAASRAQCLVHALAWYEQALQVASQLMAHPDAPLSDDDLLAALGLHARQAAPAAAKQPAPLSDTERRVLACIGPKPVGIEELCVSTGLPMSTLLGTLMKLELTGRVYKQPGQRYVLR